MPSCQFSPVNAFTADGSKTLLCSLKLIRKWDRKKILIPLNAPSGFGPDFHCLVKS